MDKRKKLPHMRSVPIGDGLGRRMTVEEMVTFGRLLSPSHVDPATQGVCPSTRPAGYSDLWLDPNEEDEEGEKEKK